MALPQPAARPAPGAALSSLVLLTSVDVFAFSSWNAADGAPVLEPRQMTDGARSRSGARRASSAAIVSRKPSFSLKW